MEEPTLELLSRSLDGDLGAAELALLEERLAADPALRAELGALSSVRDGLQALAAGEHPPAEFDAALEPLRRTAPSPVRLRPAFRWLAAAATLVVGLAVTYRVAQQGPGPVEQAKKGRAPVASPAPPAPPFQLAPLPFSRERGGEEPLGAVDHLLANPPAEPELPPPPAHTVIGPLTVEEHVAEKATAAGSPVPVPGQLEQLEQLREAEAEGIPGGTAAVPVSRPATLNAAAARDEAKPGKGEASSRQASARLGFATPQPARAQLTVYRPSGAGDAVVVTFTPREALTELELHFTVEVRQGRVAAARAISAAEFDSSLELLIAELVGLPVPDLGDGNYKADVTAQPTSGGDHGAGE